MRLAAQLTRTHTSRRTEVRRLLYVPQETYRRTCRVAQSFDRTARTSPSTFLFLLSSQFQRADPGATFVVGVGGSRASEFLRTEPFFRSPGSRSALSGVAEQWERLALGVVSGAGCIRDVSVCQHPIFNFRQNRKPKPQNRKSVSVSRAPPSVVGASQRRSPQSREPGL